ncbi:MAG: TerC family protein [Gemmatimonadales bacterium]|nr:TerC family protein [Gemmatimonadales bacterium]HRX17998.1 TerC family protein [Gemmatimonadales bacterium]
MILAGHPPGVWIGFAAVIAILLVLDLGVLNRRSHVLTPREAAAWSGGLFALAMGFAGWLWSREGSTAALEFVTGYLVELSLSVDNLFVFILIFQYFAVPARLQPKVLKWGILGALVMRGIMIAFGALLLDRFHWIIYVFGAILVVTGVRMFQGGDAHRVEPEKNPLVRLARKVLPFSRSYDEDRFFYRTRTRRLATPLLLVLLVVEWTDLVFAIDSIPAIFAVTRDPFIVYSSNIFAILGLRALFFLLAGMLERFHYLQAGVALILLFVGAKMVLSGVVHVPTPLSLGVIVVILATSVVASLVRTRNGGDGVAPAGG